LGIEQHYLPNPRLKHTPGPEHWMTPNPTLIIIYLHTFHLQSCLPSHWCLWHPITHCWHHFLFIKVHSKKLDLDTCVCVTVCNCVCVCDLTSSGQADPLACALLVYPGLSQPPGGDGISIDQGRDS